MPGGNDIIGVRVDLHCDDCQVDSTAFVTDEADGVVYLERDCCGAEVNMAPSEFAEYLRDDVN